MDFFLQISEIIRNLGLVIAAAVGIYLAWRRVGAATQQADASLQQAELARRDHVAELFNPAVGQLTHENLEIRLGAIYTLRQIARDFPDLSRPTMELLSAYLRESRKGHDVGEPSVEVNELMITLRNALRES